MESSQSLPEKLQGRSFTLDESDACGVSRRQIEKSGLVAPSRGIRVPWGIEQELADRIRPILELAPDAVASHTTAALLWGIPLPPWLQGSFEVHLSRESSRRAARRIGVSGHHTRFKPGDVMWIHGLAVTSPLRTLLDLSPMLTVEEWVAAGDYLVCEHERSFGPKRTAMVKLDVLKDAVHREFRRRGILTAREALELIRVGADSPPETFLRLSLERAGITELTLNYVVLDANGDEASWPDLAVPKWKVAIEYDGEHHLGAKQQAIDAARDKLMAVLGWRQVRITKDMLDNDGDRTAVALVLAALHAHGWTREQTPR